MTNIKSGIIKSEKELETLLLFKNYMGNFEVLRFLLMPNFKTK